MYELMAVPLKLTNVFEYWIAKNSNVILGNYINFMDVYSVFKVKMITIAYL